MSIHRVDSARGEGTLFSPECPEGHPAGGGCGGLISCSQLQAGLPIGLGQVAQPHPARCWEQSGRRCGQPWLHLFWGGFLFLVGLISLQLESSAPCPLIVHSRESLALCSPDPTVQCTAVHLSVQKLTFHFWLFHLFSDNSGVLVTSRLKSTLSPNLTNADSSRKKRERDQMKPNQETQLLSFSTALLC